MTNARPTLLSPHIETGVGSSILYLSCLDKIFRFYLCWTICFFVLRNNIRGDANFKTIFHKKKKLPKALILKINYTIKIALFIFLHFSFIKIGFFQKMKKVNNFTGSIWIE